MFQFPGFALSFKESDTVARDGLPHSEIHGSGDICSSPWLIAAYHVLHRLREPRHPSCALVSFLYDLFIWYQSVSHTFQLFLRLLRVSGSSSCESFLFRLLLVVFDLLFSDLSFQIIQIRFQYVNVLS